MNQPKLKTMPLKTATSPEAFKSNVKAEISAGKPLKQSLAIAYAQKRKASMLNRMKRGKKK